MTGMTVTEASKKLGVNVEWIKKGVADNKAFMVIAAKQALSTSYYPIYYEYGEIVPGVSHKLGTSVRVHMVIDLRNIVADPSDKDNVPKMQRGPGTYFEDMCSVPPD